MALKQRESHGGNVHAAARELRIGVRELVDFSASINPLGPSPKALRALLRGCSLLHHYPDPDCWDLRRTLAKQWRLAPEKFAIGNGSTELIHALPRALSIRHALIIGPTFSEYAKALIASGARITTLTAERADGYRQPLERATQLLQISHKGDNGRHPVDAIFLCNPNSPTGQVCAAGDVARLVNEVCHHPVWVIVDETFSEYCKARSVLPTLSQNPRLVVLRSFTKFYALPGLRIGYLVASDEVVRLVLERQPPWSVNTLAQVAAVAALNDRNHATRSLAFMKRERTRLVELFNAWPGITVFDSEANFLLVELPPACRADQVTTALRRQGLLIRDCSSTPGLNNRSIRIAVRTRGENDRLVAALKHIVKRGRRASV